MVNSKQTLNATYIHVVFCFLKFDVAEMGFCHNLDLELIYTNINIYINNNNNYNTNTNNNNYSRNKRKLTKVTRTLANQKNTLFKLNFTSVYLSFPLLPDLQSQRLLSWRFTQMIPLLQWGHPQGHKTTSATKYDKSKHSKVVLKETLLTSLTVIPIISRFTITSIASL